MACVSSAERIPSASASDTAVDNCEEREDISMLSCRVQESIALDNVFPSGVARVVSTISFALNVLPSSSSFLALINSSMFDE